MRSSSMLLLASIAVFVGACQNLDVAPENKTMKALDQKIESLTAKVDTVKDHVSEIKTDIIAKDTAAIEALKKEKSLAAIPIHTAKDLNASHPNQNRLTAEIAKDLSAAETILGGPDTAGLIEANNLLKLQLDTSEAARKEADARLATLTQRASDLEDARKKAEADASAQQSALAKASDQLQQTNTALNQTNTTYRREAKEWNARLAEKVAELEKNDAFKKNLSLYLTLAGIACGVGAALAFRFYIQLTLPLAGASGFFVLAAYLVRYIDLIIGLIAIIAAIAAAAWAWWRHHDRVATIADGTTGAIQKLKAAGGGAGAVAEAARTAYAQLRPHLVHAFGEDGHELEDQIVTRLRKRGVLGRQAEFRHRAIISAGNGQTSNPTDGGGDSDGGTTTKLATDPKTRTTG